MLLSSGGGRGCQYALRDDGFDWLNGPVRIWHLLLALVWININALAMINPVSDKVSLLIRFQRKHGNDGRCLACGAVII